MLFSIKSKTQEIEALFSSLKNPFYGPENPYDNVPITFVFSSTPTITLKKLNGENFLAWLALVEL